jgi:flagellar basal-body rod protein FlgB
VGLFDVTTTALDVALRGAELRQTALSNNLANVNTPGFKRSDVTFEDALASALSGTQDDVASVEPSIVAGTGTAMRADGNNVDADSEAASLAQTQIVFDSLMAIDSKRLRSLSSLITSAR